MYFVRDPVSRADAAEFLTHAVDAVNAIREIVSYQPGTLADAVRRYIELTRYTHTERINNARTPGV